MRRSAGTRRFSARARIVSPAERASLWAQMVNIFQLYDEYAHKTTREIPFGLLTPLDETPLEQGERRAGPTARGPLSARPPSSRAQKVS